MLKRKVAAAAVTLSLLTVIAAGPATAASSGIGTAQASTTVLGVKLGGSTNLLDLSAITDAGRSTIDKQVTANPEAFSNLTALSIGSGVLPAINGAVPAPPLEARQPNGQGSANGLAVDLGTTLGHPEIVSGTVSPASLTADLTQGAHSSVDVSLANLSLAGGLINAQSVASKLGTGAAADASSATRTVNIGAVSVLDLGALLKGLGINLADLPVQSVSGLVDTLSVTLPGGLLPDGKTVMDAQTALDSAISAVQTAITNGAGTDTVDTLTTTLGGLLNPVGVTVPSATDTLNTALANLKSALDNLLTGSLTALDNLSLLQLDGANVTINTKAVEKLTDSAATITAGVGDISVGGIVLQGVNLATAAQDISDTVGVVNDKLSLALGSISPDLANLVKVSLFSPITKTVTADNGYNRARAGITVLSASVTPPATLAAIVSTITNSQNSIADVIAANGGEVPVPLTSVMETLNRTLSQGGAALAGGAVVTVGSVLSASDYAVPAGTGTPTLAHTGGNMTLAILGLLFAMLAIGMRRWLSSPAVRD
jgi:hypothetical protein